MKLLHLYLIEDVEETSDPDKGGSKVAGVLDDALSGVAKAALFLGSIIYHGLLGKAVVAKQVDPEKAAKGLKLDRDRMIKDKLEEIKPESPPEQEQWEDENDKLFKLMMRNGQRWDRIIIDFIPWLNEKDSEAAAKYVKLLNRMSQRLRDMIERGDLETAASGESKMLKRLEDKAVELRQKYEHDIKSDKPKSKPEPKEPIDDEEDDIGSFIDFEDDDEF